MNAPTQNPALSQIVARQLRGERWHEIEDLLVVEEPLEIRLNGRRYTATMRTPQGQEWDERLALGLLFTEGVVHDRDDIEKVTHGARCRELNAEMVNVVDVTLHDDSGVPTHLFERSIISNSSCGLCGKASVEAFGSQFAPLTGQSANIDLIRTLPGTMQQQQTLFEQTGGLHAAAIFDGTGQLLACSEDIGRHNATDKVVGLGLQQGFLPGQRDLILLVSGRASFEIVQKCLVARIGTLVAVSAASSLAVELAKQNNLNLIGFLRERGLTVYSEAVPTK